MEVLGDEKQLCRIQPHRLNALIASFYLFAKVGVPAIKRERCLHRGQIINKQTRINWQPVHGEKVNEDVTHGHFTRVSEVTVRAPAHKNKYSRRSFYTATRRMKCSTYLNSPFTACNQNSRFNRGTRLTSHRMNGSNAPCKRGKACKIISLSRNRPTSL